MLRAGTRDVLARPGTGTNSRTQTRGCGVRPRLSAPDLGEHVATQHAGERLGRDGNAWAAADWCPPAAAITAPAVGQFERRARAKPATDGLH